MSKLSETYRRIYDIVRKIPRGRVATYGQIAALAGMPRQARLVGYAMNAVVEPDIPWHRVINARGEISSRSGAAAGESESRQRRLLESEGIRFSAAGRIEMEQFRWEPGIRELESE